MSDEIKELPNLQTTIIGKGWITSQRIDGKTVKPQRKEVESLDIILGEDMIFSANRPYGLHNGYITFRTDRYLNTSTVAGEIKPLELKAGATLAIFDNPKRPDKGLTDPDYSISVQLEPEVSETIKANSKAGLENWRTENPQAPTAPATPENPNAF
jgi:hypothetical protein